MLISMVRVALTLGIFFPFPWRNITKSKITSARVYWCQEFSLCKTPVECVEPKKTSLKETCSMWMLHLNDAYDINMHQHVPMLHQNRDASDISLLQNLIAGGHTLTYQSRIHSDHDII